MKEQAPAPQEKPGLIKRAAIGIKNFVTHAVGYIPRGIVLTGGVFAASALLEGYTGMPLLGIKTATTEGLVVRGLAHLAVGSFLSGAIGGGLAAYNAGRGSSEQLRPSGIASIITPSDGEMQAAQAAVGQVQEAGLDTITHGLPIGAAGKNLLNQMTGR